MSLIIFDVNFVYFINLLMNKIINYRG